MLRTLLILAVLFIAARYAYKLFRPPRRTQQENIKGRPKESQRTIDRSQIEDAQFKDIPEK